MNKDTLKPVTAGKQVEAETSPILDIKVGVVNLLLDYKAKAGEANWNETNLNALRDYVVQMVNEIFDEFPR